MGRNERTICRLCREKNIKVEVPVGERRIHLFEKYPDEVELRENWVGGRGLPVIEEAIEKDPDRFQKYLLPIIAMEMRKNPNLLKSHELFELIQKYFDFDP